MNPIKMKRNTTQKIIQFIPTIKGVGYEYDSLLSVYKSQAEDLG
jgi:hypothetical protein